MGTTSIENDVRFDYEKTIDAHIKDQFGDPSKASVIEQQAFSQAKQYLMQLYKDDTVFPEYELSTVINSFVSGYLLHAGILDF